MKENYADTYFLFAMETHTMIISVEGKSEKESRESLFF